MIEFKDRLRELMNENGIKTPKELSDKLNALNNNSNLHSNTIRNYLNGKSPKDVGKYKILANFFGVSTDYLQGYAKEKTNDIDIKNICNEYGLTEKALQAIKQANDMNKSFIDNNNNGDKFKIHRTIDTINFLLEELEENRDNSILYQINTYFIAYTDYSVSIPTNVNPKNKKVFEKATIDGEKVIQYILDDIEYKIKEARLKLKEGENW